MKDETLENINLLIAIPTMANVHALLVNRLVSWARLHRNISIYFEYHVAPVERARNRIVKFFLNGAEGKFTHLLFIDSDTIPPADAINRLLSHGKDIVSGLTPIAHYNTNDNTLECHDNCFIEPKRDNDGKIVQTNIAQRHTGLQELLRCGGSCILIKRAVFEALKTPYYEFTTNEEMTENIRSEDINFCDKAREAGFKIYADTDVVCSHYKEVMI